MSGRRPKPLDDRTSRVVAQREFAAPVVIEAGAGTGKTTLLVARVVAWCVGPGWRERGKDTDARELVAREVIEGVAAITFTEAAAAEMANRIGVAFAELARYKEPEGWAPEQATAKTDPNEIAVRAAALCGESHRLSVSTIHAFCQRVLTAHPFEAGLHPRFEIDADGSRLEKLVDEVVEGALRGLESSPHRERWERLAVAGNGPTEVAEALRSLVSSGVSAAELERNPFGADAAARVSDGLQCDLDAFFAVEEGRLTEVPRTPDAGRVRAALHELAAELDGLGTAPAFDELHSLVASLDPKVARKLERWSKLDFSGGERSCLDEMAREVASAAGVLLARIAPLADLRVEQFEAARGLLASMLREVEERRRAVGQVTFNDLLRRTADLFDEHAGIRRTERRRIDQLLVDEFQDTDDVQCRIVKRLGLEGPVEQRPGLFIVGDPKQSIYAWRSADLAAYDAFVDVVLEGGGVFGSLSRNFRSDRPILEEVERVVKDIMHHEPGFQPPFQALDATGDRAASAGFDHPPWTAVENWVTWPVNDDGVPDPTIKDAKQVFELEGRAIAADIRRLHEEAGVAWGDIGVLLRASTAQKPLLEAFREWGVPFEVAREREYYRQREIVETAALIRAVLEPGDLLALLTVIRSDVVGVPDAALAPLWSAGFPAAVAAADGRGAAATGAAVRIVSQAARTVEPAPGSDLLPEWPSALAGAVEVLAELRRSKRENPPGEFVERVRTLWLAEVSAGARYLGRFRQARLDRFLLDLERAITGADDGDAELARFLRRAVAENREVQNAAEPDRSIDAVHVMTVYGAKGLDFEHVYLAQVHKGVGGRGPSPTTAVERFEGATELRLFGWMTPGFELARLFRGLQARAEQVRLLYVGTTRAKKRLVVSGRWSASDDEVDPMRAKNLAELLAHRSDRPAIAGLAEKRGGRMGGGESSVSWVMPTVAAIGRHPTSSAGGDHPSRWAEAVDADAQVIADARRWARRRMAAPWVVPASDAAQRSWRREEVEVEASTAPPSTGRNVAAVVGTAVHRLFETLDLGDELVRQVADSRRSMVEAVAEDLERAPAKTATVEIDDLLDRLVTSRCLEKLGALASAVVARELPVLVPPGVDDGSSVISGVVDLVYRDPADGRLVVADYKTDRVTDDTEITERTERYRPQLETYAGALEQALGLDARPHRELWFLHPDRIVRLD
jgi:ATP-dependent helicase/nuclease subunit A